ncbi:serine/threonine-protein kinase [Niveomyces insectorum RCEF 264]|uniref:Serine/threonine-protein kinase n=1 Tax=Niveomyces insectorum RCEF 264 TaxID=1081102 RepID=A0A167Z6F6_9HYPO|nr:serine/threonine-protein kinase [Niveomyces insectorum RCEF 264]
MPTSPVTSPRFPQYQGFKPLRSQWGDEDSNASRNGSRNGSGSHNNNNNNSTMDHEVDIPLTQIRTASSTGARRANQGGVGPEITRLRSASRQDSGGGGSGGSGDEKHGLFKSRSGPIGRRRVKREPDPAKRRGTFDSDVAVNFMGKLYTRLVSASVLTRYLVYIVPVAFLLAIPIVLLPATGNANTIPLGSVVTNRTAVPPTRDYGPPLFHLFIWFEASWAGLWAGKIVAYLIPIAFMFFCGVISSGTRKYATVLRALEIPLSLFFWALVSWLVFRFLFTDTRLSWIYAITNILGSLFVSSAVFLAERAIIQLMSISYHQRSFANRIKESKRDIYLLGLMYDASRTLFPMYCEEFADEDYLISDSIDLLLRRGNNNNNNNNSNNYNAQRPGNHRKTGSVTPMRLIGNVGRFGDKMTSAFGNLASEITGKQVFNPHAAHSIVVEALEKVRSSEALARRIWMSFVVEDRDALYPDDIEEVLGPTHKEEAEECFAAIDADGNGDISLDEMIRKVVAIGKERKAMANSMKDISEALASFDHVMLFLVLLLVIFIFLAFFQSSFITTLATAGTALLSLSFVFAVTTQEILGSCIFLFVKHPYDVGDRVDITGPEKEQLIVEKISLLYTVFKRIDRMQAVQVPNIVLNNLWIENVTRSKAQSETIEVGVSYDTSFDDLELLRLELEKFVRHPDNARDFQPDLIVTVNGVGNLDKLLLNVTVKHKSNWHNDVVRATRRSKFMCALALALKKVPIFGPGGGGDAAGSPSNPTYSVSVSDEVAAAARAASAREKNANRMVPIPDPDDTDGDGDGDGDNGGGGRGGHGNSKSRSKSTEKRAARDLNTRLSTSYTDDYTLNDGGSQESSSPLDNLGGSGGAVNRMPSRAAQAQASSFLHPSASQSQSRSRVRHRGSSAASRSDDIEDIRRELHLNKAQSQRGRRQAGQGLPPMSLGEEIPPSAEGVPQRLDGGPPLDLERGIGDDASTTTTTGGNPYGNPYGIPPAPPQAAVAPTGCYGMYAPPSAPAAAAAVASVSGAPPPPPQPPMASPAHPLQSAPAASSSSAATRGRSPGQSQQPPYRL